ncbi:MAG TPA: ABC transporter permease [Candidatus Polarisedimenticolia bacterium]|nr:ABC transporter permease [Candidatus Polarisedimenticolia bacterium]
MSPFSILRVAWKALLRNRMRSFLTTLGVIIGVAAVIAMVAIGEGAKARVEQSFAAMGTSMLIVMSGTTTSGGARGGFGSMPTLTWDDLRAIQTEVPSVRLAVPSLRSVSQVLSEDQNWTTTITGTTPEYFDIRSWGMQRGAAFTSSDVDGATKVAVLGQTVSDRLFGPGNDAVGQIVRIRNIPFQVVGVMQRKGQSPQGQDYDDAVLVPASTFQTKIQGGLQKFINGAIFVGAVSPGETARAESEVTALLRDRHRIQPGTDDDFSIRNLTEIASAQQEGTRTLTLLLSSIAAVSLLVGGIGIMNIMLVSVTERTREIGLRMAVGAKPKDILAQFLAEALALSTAGGLFGVGLGLFVANRLATQFDWPMLVRPDIILISVGFSSLVGIAFGLYPARKASLLDPIEALRYE